MPYRQSVNMRVLGYTVTILVYVWNGFHIKNQIQLADKTDPNVLQFIDLYIQHKYFTFWNCYALVIHAILGLSCDVLALWNLEDFTYESPKYLKTARDTLFAAVVFPSTFVTASFFWSLFLYDRDLIMPEAVDQVLPPISNHIVHTLIVPLVLWEVKYQPRSEPRTHLPYIAAVFVYLISYLCMLAHTFVTRGTWTYRCFDLIYTTMTPLYPMFLFSFALLQITFYYLQWTLSSLVWQRRSGVSKRKLK